MIQSGLARKWTQLAPREQQLVAGAAGLVVAAIVWWLLLAPALGVVRSAEAQHRALDTQLQRMRGLQAQAVALQSQPRQTVDEASRQLEATVKDKFGTNARMTIAGERVTIALTGASPEALGQWLIQARTNARALPVEARLTRNAASRWDGTLVLALPAAR